MCAANAAYDFDVVASPRILTIYGACNEERGRGNLSWNCR